MAAGVDDHSSEGRPAGVWGVRAALGLAGRAVAEGVPGTLWVAGEVLHVSRSAAGHLYVTLVEGDARLSCVALGVDAERVTSTLAAAGVVLGEGLAVRFAGELRVYPPRGTVELAVHAVDPRASVGDVELARRAARARLEAAGVWEAQRRLSAPLAPLRVAVVAPVGAGLSDLLGVLDASGWAFGVRVHPVISEGPGAPAAIAAGLREAAAGAQVVVLARGGGAGVRLAYDSEDVARAVATCPVPVLAAVGHSTDRSLTDEVAWAEMATPTAAGEWLCQRVATTDRQVAAAGSDLAREARLRLAEAGRELEAAEAACAQARAVAAARRAAPTTGERRRERVAIAAAVVLAVTVAVLVLVVVLR